MPSLSCVCTYSNAHRTARSRAVAVGRRASDSATNVTMPFRLRGNPERRTIDLGYAITGHRAQGVTLDRALVRVAGMEDREWFYVGATRAARETRFYDVHNYFVPG